MSMQPFLLVLQEASEKQQSNFGFSGPMSGCPYQMPFHFNKIQAMHIASFFHWKDCLDKTVTVTVLSGLITDLTSLWPTDHANRIYAYLEEIVVFSVFSLKRI